LFASVGGVLLPEPGSVVVLAAAGCIVVLGAAGVVVLAVADGAVVLAPPGVLLLAAAGGVLVLAVADGAVVLAPPGVLLLAAAGGVAVLAVDDGVAVLAAAGGVVAGAAAAAPAALPEGAVEQTPPCITDPGGQLCASAMLGTARAAMIASVRSPLLMELLREGWHEVSGDGAARRKSNTRPTNTVPDRQQRSALLNSDSEVVLIPEIGGG